MRDVCSGVARYPSPFMRSINARRGVGIRIARASGGEAASPPRENHQRVCPVGRHRRLWTRPRSWPRQRAQGGGHPDSPVGCASWRKRTDHLWFESALLRAIDRCIPSALGRRSQHGHRKDTRRLAAANRARNGRRGRSDRPHHLELAVFVTSVFEYRHRASPFKLRRLHAAAISLWANHVQR